MATTAESRSLSPTRVGLVTASTAGTHLADITANLSPGCLSNLILATATRQKSHSAGDWLGEQCSQRWIRRSITVSLGTWWGMRGPGFAKRWEDRGLAGTMRAALTCTWLNTDASRLSVAICWGAAVGNAFYFSYWGWVDIFGCAIEPNSIINLSWVQEMRSYFSFRVSSVSKPNGFHLKNMEAKSFWMHSFQVAKCTLQQRVRWAELKWCVGQTTITLSTAPALLLSPSRAEEQRENHSGPQTAECSAAAICHHPLENQSAPASGLKAQQKKYLHVISALVESVYCIVRIHPAVALLDPRWMSSCLLLQVI